MEEYYNAEKFDNEAEAETFVELINTGKVTKSNIRSNWKIEIDPALLPVKKRKMIAQLIKDVETSNLI